jgi:hypothetical protein
MEARPAALARAGGDGARKQPHGPAPAPPALSPKDTRYSAQSRASNQSLLEGHEKGNPFNELEIIENIDTNCVLCFLEAPII